MFLKDFLSWEARQEVRHEFNGVQPIAMTGGTRSHGRIQRNLAVSVGGRLSEGPCEFLGSDFQLRTGNRVRYPDGMVFCSRGEATDTSAGDPVIIFEVLSSSTAGTDRIVKVRECQSLPSLRRYILLEQDRIAATALAREDGSWSSSVVTGGELLSMPEIDVTIPLSELSSSVVTGGELLSMPEIDVTIPLSEIYRGVDLDPERMPPG